MQQKGNLTMSQIILASASPRRRELLEQIGLNFEVCPAKGEEIIDLSIGAPNIPPAPHIRVALCKKSEAKRS